jgi:hypothetical protein
MATSIAELAAQGGRLSIGSSVTKTAQIGVDISGVQQLGRFRIAFSQQGGHDLRRRVVDAALCQCMSALVNVSGSGFVGHFTDIPIH